MKQQKQAILLWDHSTSCVSPHAPGFRREFVLNILHGRLNLQPPAFDRVMTVPTCSVTLQPQTMTLYQRADIQQPDAGFTSKNNLSCCVCICILRILKKQKEFLFVKILMHPQLSFKDIRLENTLSKNPWPQQWGDPVALLWCWNSFAHIVCVSLEVRITVNP